jgi:hypothetical protein
MESRLTQTVATMSTFPHLRQYPLQLFEIQELTLRS